MKKIILLSLLCLTGCQSQQHVNNTTTKADSASTKDNYPAWVDRSILPEQAAGSMEDAASKPVIGLVSFNLVEINSESSRRLVAECLSNHIQSNGVLSSEELEGVLAKIKSDPSASWKASPRFMLQEDRAGIMSIHWANDNGLEEGGNVLSAKVSGPNDGEQVLHITAQGLREKSDAKPNSPLERWTLVRSASVPMNAGLICEVEEKTDAPKLVVFVKRSKA